MTKLSRNECRFTHKFSIIGSAQVNGKVQNLPKNKIWWKLVSPIVSCVETIGRAHHLKLYDSRTLLIITPASTLPLVMPHLVGEPLPPPPPAPTPLEPFLHHAQDQYTRLHPPTVTRQRAIHQTIGRSCGEKSQPRSSPTLNAIPGAPQSAMCPR